MFSNKIFKSRAGSIKKGFFKNVLNIQPIEEDIIPEPQTFEANVAGTQTNLTVNNLYYHRTNIKTETILHPKNKPYVKPMPIMCHDKKFTLHPEIIR